MGLVKLQAFNMGIFSDVNLLWDNARLKTNRLSDTVETRRKALREYENS